MINRVQLFQFLSTPSARRATGVRLHRQRIPVISIHALREEGDRRSEPLQGLAPYFYPRPPRGGRRGGRALEVLRRKFLSTPSARRATQVRRDQWRVQVYFYPRPPRGGRPSTSNWMAARSLFLSTPSARRATHAAPVVHELLSISIHALREEGDRTTWTACPLPTYFYPRPPRGGRHPDRGSTA